MPAEHIALFGMIVNSFQAQQDATTTYKLVAITNKGGGIEPAQLDATTALVVKFDATSYGLRKDDEKLMAPELENIHFSIPVTIDEKKHNIEEITVNRKEMVLEVHMAENPNVHARV
ncbi:hypothetical protein L1987_48621 [Smallanthus sonchifolius]|uniref:Uncharacterized protein n=1 Tax=Smallanthus sonchifolius TaxID=185202 RepID=A0ACB9FTG7_9ASTR|nr:hypothetical protein L1987_48621 [Smallanthus sonchifolius]